jgi:hypothetical protein
MGYKCQAQPSKSNGYFFKHLNEYYQASIDELLGLKVSHKSSNSTTVKSCMLTILQITIQEEKLWKNLFNVKEIS